MYCPLTKTRDNVLEAEAQCDGEACAWWDKYNHRCAVLEMVVLLRTSSLKHPTRQPTEEGGE